MKMIRIFTVSIAFIIYVNITVGQDNQFIQRTHQYLNDLAKDENFCLSICISKDNEVLLNKAFGHANREHEVSANINTTFSIASIGKLFTAVSILQLKEKGKLDLQSNIGTYLPDFPNQFIRDSTTVHQLLTHTSGLPLWFDEGFDSKPKYSYLELIDYLELYQEINIDTSRIGKNNYSNSGYIALGYIIEEISGKTFKTYLNESIFMPLGMEATNVWNLTEIIPNVASGYTRPTHPNDNWKTNHHLNIGSCPAGGTYASSQDLIKFYNALLSNRLIKEETKQLMFSPKVKTQYGEYGYGIGISANNSKKIIGHLGGYYGVRGELMWYKDSNYIVSILANSDQTDYIDISNFIRTELTGTANEKEAFENTLELLKLDTDQEIVSYQDLDGEYQSDDFDEALIQIKAYYYYNIQAYKKAMKLFRLNARLFPNSPSAIADLKMLEN